jgi:putative nucleotidyltransferase with HDIG domain
MTQSDDPSLGRMRVAPSAEPDESQGLPALTAELLACQPEPLIHEVSPSLVPLAAGLASITPRPSTPPLGALPTDSLLPSVESDLEREIVRQLRTGRAALPVLPQVAEAALRLANDPDARIDQLARLVDTDPPIAARFMSVANSVAYWRGMIAASTQSAIVRLGLANTRDLLFQVVYAASTHGLKKYQTVVQKSFKRSVVAAVAARVTAQQIGYSGDYDYMSGLLHDIGEARIYRILDGVSAPSDDRNLVKRLVQKYHCVAGAEIAMAWKLPTQIVDACAAHHDPGAAENPHVRLVMIADVIVEAVEAASVGTRLDFEAFERLGVDVGIARLLIDRTQKGVAGGQASLRP